MRNIKSEDELINLRKAAELADYAIEVGCKEIAEGKTELEILMAIEFEMKKKGAEKCRSIRWSFLVQKQHHHMEHLAIVKSKKEISFCLTLVSSINGYCSDITRTVAFGEPTDAQREIYETVRKAEQAAVDLVRPGVKAMEIDKAARDVIDRSWLW